jgi:CubicO group peptidase (beta-lactamase class C family)
MIRPLALGLILALGAAPALAQPGDDLVGLWSATADAKPPLAGRLTLVQEHGAWRATLAGHRAAVRAIHGEVRLGFAPNLGQLRVRTSDDALRAYWLQPAGGFANAANPGGASQPFASPVALRRTGPHAWTGEVTPLRARYTLYLKVFRGEDGALTAAFRNPEAGSTGGRGQFQVSRAGDTVTFASPPAPGATPVSHTAHLDGGRLRLMWPDLGRPLELKRSDGARAAAFYPRPPGTAPYRYRRPPALHDGWTTARAGEVGLDEAALERAVQKQIDADPAARRPSLMHSMLIARRGKLVLEEYFFGFDRRTPHDLRSAGKTFAAVLTGAVQMRDPRFGPDTAVYPLLAPLGPFGHPDPRKDRITLGQLMTHTSGLACNDNDPDSPGEEGRMQMQTAQPDWWRHELDLPLVHEPGERYAYCSGGMNLVGAALTRESRTWLPELFETRVARPLQFGPWWWNLMPTGEGYLGGGAFLAPRDLLKVGQAWLDGGTWRGHRIAPEAWVALSVAPHVQVNPATTGLSEDEFGNFYGRGADGYAWHLGEIKVGGRSYKSYQASGNGGQLLVAVPEADLVAVFTGANYGQGGIWSRWPNDYLGGFVLAGMK